MGSIHSLYTQSFPPKPKFTVESIPDLTGKVIIVTGGNSGIGKETVKALLLHNAKVYIAARNQEKVEHAIQELEAATQKRAIFLKVDLANLHSIKAGAEEFLSKESQLHVLFNNGGVMTPPIDLLTEDGYDLQFGTNVLGHFYLTKLLLPALIATARETNEPARIVNTSSSAQQFASRINFDTLRDGPRRRKAGTISLYAQSKFGNVVLSSELAKRYGNHGIVSTSLNPGNLKTELQRHLSSFREAVINWMLHPAHLGALTQLWAGTTPEAAKFNGKYLIPWARIGAARKETSDLRIGEELWSWLEAQVKDI